MKNKFKSGQIAKHIRTQSTWLIVEVKKPKMVRLGSTRKKELFQQIDAVCLQTGKPLSGREETFWKIGQLDTWYVNVDKNKEDNYFDSMWKIVTDR